MSDKNGKASIPSIVIRFPTDGDVDIQLNEVNIVQEIAGAKLLERMAMQQLDAAQFEQLTKMAQQQGRIIPAAAMPDAGRN